MRLPIFPSKDASIYSEVPNRNTGLDEILEIGKSDEGNYVKRALLDFPIDDIAAAISAGTIPSGAYFDLTLYVARASNLKVGSSLEVRRVAEGWQEGSGYFGQENIQEVDGVTWNCKASGSTWESGSVGNSMVAGALTYSFPIRLSDVTVDVTSYVQNWINSGGNNGFVIKFPDAAEADANNHGCVRFFSKDTHTVYRPVLTAKWDDQTYTTGSMTAYPSTGLLVTPATLKPTYSVGETVRVDLSVRPATPLKTFDTVFSNYAGNRYLPTTAYFSIVDDLSGTTIIPFDDYSKISCDGTTSYFKFKVDNMYPLRYYRVKIKVVHNGLTEIFDAGYVFKVTT
jgi:hypothetical protein